MRSWQRVIVILLTMLMVRYFLLLQTALLFWQVVAVFFAFFLVARTRFFDLVWFAGIVVICFPIHRSVIMFFPIAIFWSWIFSLGATRDWGRRESWKYPLIFIIPAVCYAFFSGALLLWIYAHPIALGFANGANAIMFKVYSVLTGKPRIAIDSLDLVSSSYQNSFVEWVRVSSPALHIIGIVFLATTFAWNWKRPREQRTSAQTTSLILGAVSVVAAATALTFSGIPFIYRGQFFIVLFQSIFIALCLDEAFESGWMKSPAFRAIAALSIAAFANVSAVSFYKFQWSFAQILNPYLSRLFPINQLLLIAVATLGLIVATRALKNERLTVKMLLVSALLLDTFSVVTKFYEYSYGSAFPEPRIIAHYERRDLEAAKLIENLPAGTMLFSDPFTISMLKATTGFNGLYGNENLADLKPEKLKHVRATLNALLVSASALESETLKDVEQREALGPEALYAFERAHGKGSYTFENVRPSIIFAISRRSLDYNPPNGTGYYPPYRELEPREVETLERNLDVIARHGNYMVFARLKSQGPDAHLGKVNAQKESRSN